MATTQEQRPLILVDDDAEDQELMMLALKELGFQNKIKIFSDAESALDYLYKSGEQPFLIVSDINMPRMNGITFKKKIDSCNILRPKCIPFIFLSTSANFVDETCNMNIQGYFVKGTSWAELQETMKIILRYWERTRHQHLN
jgi:two-component SAPR family response regulator